MNKNEPFQITYDELRARSDAIARLLPSFAVAVRAVALVVCSVFWIAMRIKKVVNLCGGSW